MAPLKEIQMKAVIAKSIALIALSFGAAQAQAECRIVAYSTHAINDVFYGLGGWTTDRGLVAAKYDEVCRKLEKAGAGIEISAMAKVLGDEYTVSWAQLAVKDKNTSIGNLEYGSKAVQISNVGTQQKANEDMVLAINLALSNWVGLDMALETLEKERKIARAAILKKK
jgi:hypothetical protein